MENAENMKISVYSLVVVPKSIRILFRLLWFRNFADNQFVGFCFVTSDSILYEMSKKC